MDTTIRTSLTGSVAFLFACLASTTGATAEVDPVPVNMALDPAAHDLAAPVPTIWPTPTEAGTGSADRWSDVFGGPDEAAVPQVASFTSPVDHAPMIRVSAMPSPAYRVHDNQHVRFFLDRFQTGYRRAIVESRLVRAGRYLPMILDVFRQKGLPDELVFTAMIESGFNPMAVSRAGAKGLWQFMAPTARRYGLRIDEWLDERLDPEKSTIAAARHLLDLYAVFGSWNLVQAAYNAGEMKVLQAIRAMGSSDFWTLRRGAVLQDETKNFIPAIHAATLIAREPERYGFVVTPASPLQYEVVVVPGSTSLRQ